MFEHIKPSRLRLVLLSACLAVGSVSWAAEYSQTRDAATGAYSWRVNDRGFSLELIQFPPEYTRAFYESRDLPPALREELADYCTFGSVARNESDAPVTYRVADWRALTADGKQRKFRTKSEWLALWKKLATDSRFSILPDDMTFEVGDWAQGLSAVKLPRGTKFDLIYTWRTHGKTLTGKLPGVVCPNDALPAGAP